VSKTSPISNLAIIGRLDLLRSQFDAVFIPEAVRAALEHLPDPVAQASIEAALQLGWLRCPAVANPRLAAALGNDLDTGEAEAMAPTAEIQPDALLTDEKEGRSVARHAGLPAGGVLGAMPCRSKGVGNAGNLTFAHAKRSAYHHPCAAMLIDSNQFSDSTEVPKRH
jgi:hypothetical protein